MINLKKSCSDRTLGFNSNRYNLFSYHAEVVNNKKSQINVGSVNKIILFVLQKLNTVLFMPCFGFRFLGAYILEVFLKDIYEEDRRSKSMLESI